MSEPWAARLQARHTGRQDRKRVSFELINLMELIGESMGIHIPDLYRRLRLLGDIDAVIADSADLIAAHDLDLETVRDVLAKDLAGAA